ncbi:MAG: 3-deoxy-manno-octulosonate cytidylyltransferase [Bdellovibrionales bacterium]
MKTWVVIPARYGSTRFPGKPLVKIAGVPLLERVIQKVQKAQGVDRILVATDHAEIESLCRGLKIAVVQTDSHLTSGTDRIFQALQKSDDLVSDDDLIINVQGDEPLLPASWIEGLAKAFRENPRYQMGTLAHPLTWEELENPNSVKVLCDQDQFALYFSRYPIPHSREKSGGRPVSLKHIGVYAFRYSVLKRFCQLPPSEIEKAESLEQLRALQAGIRIWVMSVEGSIQGVDVPDDVQKVEKILRGSV